MAIPERDTVYTNDGTNRTVYTRESSSSTGWFVGIIVALALLAIGYLMFSANSGPSTTSIDVNNTPAVTSPVADPAVAPTPMVEAPAPATATPMTEATPAPATDAAPAVTPAPATTPAPAATPAPATTPAQ